MFKDGDKLAIQVTPELLEMVAGEELLTQGTQDLVVEEVGVLAAAVPGLGTLVRIFQETQVRRDNQRQVEELEEAPALAGGLGLPNLVEQVMLDQQETQDQQTQDQQETQDPQETQELQDKHQLL